MTMQLNNRLNECALALQDKKLMSKLSAGDVVVQEIKYIPTCLTKLYIRERAVKKLKEREASGNVESGAEVIDLAELITCIVEPQRNSGGGNAFPLADLADM